MKTKIFALVCLLAAAPCFAQRPILKGATDQTTYIRIIDSADGTAETGVTSATSGLDLEYVRLGAAPVDLTESDLAATDSAHSDGGIKHVGGGRYRVDLPDAACASSAGVNEVAVQGVCTGMIVIPATYPLVAYDPYDAVRLGLTSLPNVASGNAGAVLTAGTGTAQLSVSSGRANAVIPYDPKVWYVDSAGGSDSNDGHSWATAKQTATATLTASAAGDTIYLLGSFTMAGNTPKDGQRWIGFGWDETVLTRNGGVTSTIYLSTSNNVTLENMKIVNTGGSGKALQASTASGCVLRRVWCDAPFDAARLDGFDDGTIEFCKFTATSFDGLIVNGKNNHVSDSLMQTTAVTGSPAQGAFRTDSADTSSTATFITFNRCEFSATRAASDADPCACAELNAYSRVVFNQCRFRAVGSHASEAGNIVCILCKENSHAEVDGCTFSSSNAGAGLARDIYLANSGVCQINPINTNYDSAKVTGTPTLRVPNVAPAANGGLPTADASNRIAGIAGTLSTLDALDTAQDSQHSTTQAALTTVDTVVDGIAEDVTGLGSVTQIATTYANKARTWLPGVDGSKASNVVTVKAGAEGTFSAKMALNEGADIDDVVSVTVTDPEDDPVVATNLRKTADGLQANFDLPELTVAGDYVVVVTVETIDDATIPMECKLTVRP